MKKLIVAAAGTVAMMAGTAYAGCLNGSHASAEADAAVIASAEETEAGLLAKLQEQEEAEALEKLIETRPTFN